MKAIANGVKHIIIFVFFAVLMGFPIIYYLGNEEVHDPGWLPQYKKYDNPELDLSSVSQFTNIYLHPKKIKANERDLVELNHVSNIISHKLNSKKMVTIKKVLDFKEPKSNKNSQEYQQLRNEIYNMEEPPLKAIKQQLDQYVNFQHHSLEEKVWLIVSVDKWAAAQTAIVNKIIKGDDNDKIVVVSLWPISAKGIKFDGVSFNKDENSQRTDAQSMVEGA